MRNFIFAMLAIILSSPISCTCIGDAVEVPPAHMGKLRTEDGLSEKLYLPGQFRLEGGCFICDKLVIAQTTDIQFEEKMELFMPKDKLTLTFDLRGLASVEANEEVAKMIFERIPAKQTDDSNISRISTSKVYGIYAQNVLRTAARNIVARNTIDEVLLNREAISASILEAVATELAKSPIKIKSLGLAAVDPPKVIKDAQIKAKKREVALKTAEADKAVALKEAEKDLEVAKKQQAIDLIEAETRSKVARAEAAGTTNAWFRRKELEVMALFAKSSNAKFVVPLEAVKNPGLFLGLSK